MVKKVAPMKKREPKTRPASKNKVQKNIEKAAAPFLTGESKKKKRDVFNSLVTGDKAHAMAVFTFVLESPSNPCVSKHLMNDIRVWVANNVASVAT